MSRKKPLSPSSPPVHFLGSQPWWLSVLLAVGSGLYLHSVAVDPLPEFAGGHSGGLAVSAMFQKMAVFGQYLLPLIFLAGAAGSLLKRRKVLAAPEVGPAVEEDKVEVAAPEVVEAPTVTPVAVAVAPPPTPPPVVEPKAPACPHCKKIMVMKVAGSGANAGGNFWGCVDYPKCRGIRAIFAPMK